MKRGTPDHPKIKRLARLLKINRGWAVGIMEVLWHTTADYALAGDIGRLTDDEIAEAVFWDGPPSKLIDALVEARLVDLHETCRLIIHDWPDHIDRTAKQRAADRGITFVQNLAESGRTCAAGSRLPEPEPEPAPSRASPACQAAAAAMKKALEDRGITSSNASHWVAQVHPDDIAEVVAFFDWRIKPCNGDKLRSQIGSLKKMLEAPDNWGFTRDERGRLVRPKEASDGRRLDQAAHDVLALKQGGKADKDLMELLAKMTASLKRQPTYTELEVSWRAILDRRSRSA